MPMREINQKFTKSELLISAWRSRELAYNLRPKDTGNDSDRRRRMPVDYEETTPKLRELEMRLAPIADKITDDNGEVDLHKLTGNEALHFMGAMGIPLGRA